MLFRTDELPHVATPLPKNYGWKKHRPARFRTAADDAIGEGLATLEAGDVLSWWTDGRWSMHELIGGVLDRTGPARLTVATWTVKEAPLRALKTLQERGQIVRLVGIVDSRNEGTNADAYHYARRFFDQVVKVHNHAKIAVIQNERWSVSIVGSANLTKNPRREAGVILTDPGTAHFYEFLLTETLETDERRTTNRGREPRGAVFQPPGSGPDCGCDG